jgi:hypothetical protein
MEGDYSQQGRQSIYALSQKNMQEDKMLLYSLLARGIDLDSTSTGIPLFALIS